MSYNNFSNYATFVIFDEAIEHNEMHFLDCLMSDCIMLDVLNTNHLSQGNMSRLTELLAQNIRSYCIGYPDDNVNDIGRWSQAMLGHINWMQLADHVFDVVMNDALIWDTIEEHR